MAERNLPRLVMIGASGTGKSATSNSLCGSSLFPVSAKPTSVTFETTVHPVKWFGQKDEPEFIAIDTPGLGDSEGRDTQHIANMVAKLKELKSVNGFLIVFNG
jgi:predicted GTPase